MKIFILGFLAQAAQSATITCQPEGFSAVITAADVFEDPTKVDTSSNEYKVIVGSTGNSTCHGVLVNDTVSLDYSTDSCKWTELQITPVYNADSNAISYTVSAGVAENPTITIGNANIMLTRAKPLSITCQYNANFKIEYNNLYVTAATASAEQQNETISEIWKNYFTLSAYTDSAYNKTISTDNKVRSV